jgi:hypothetical protein
MARANLAAHHLAGSARFICADVTALPLPPVAALFVDPARRADGRRRFRLAAYPPSYDQIAGWARRVPAIGVKVAPGIADDETPPAAEVEFVALGGELKAALLWLGPLRTAARRRRCYRPASAWPPTARRRRSRRASRPVISTSPTRPSSAPTCWIRSPRA